MTSSRGTALITFMLDECISEREASVKESEEGGMSIGGSGSSAFSWIVSVVPQPSSAIFFFSVSQSAVNYKSRIFWLSLIKAPVTSSPFSRSKGSARGHENLDKAIKS